MLMVDLFELEVVNINSIKSTDILRVTPIYVHPPFTYFLPVKDISLSSAFYSLV